MSKDHWGNMLGLKLETPLLCYLDFRQTTNFNGVRIVSVDFFLKATSYTFKRALIALSTWYANEAKSITETNRSARGFMNWLSL